MASVFETLQKIFGILSIILLVVSTFGNLFSFYVCKRIKKNSTFTFLTFLAISDLLTLYYWNLNNFLTQFTSVNLYLTNLWVCKIGNFVQFSSLQCSAWLLVVLCWDRFLSVRFNHWKTIYFKSPRPLIAAIVTVAIILLINVNILFTFGYDVFDGNKTLSFCFEIPGVPSTAWMNIWGKVHLGLYSLVPFLVIAISNFALLYQIYIKKSTIRPNAITREQRSRQDRLNKTVLLMTFLFIVMTAPIAMASFFFNDLFATDYGVFIIYLVDFISFCYHGLNFIVMAFSNRMFYNECLKVLGFIMVEESSLITNMSKPH